MAEPPSIQGVRLQRGKCHSGPRTGKLIIILFADGLFSNILDSCWFFLGSYFSMLGRHSLWLLNVGQRNCGLLQCCCFFFLNVIQLGSSDHVSNAVDVCQESDSCPSVAGKYAPVVTSGPRGRNLARGLLNLHLATNYPLWRKTGILWFGFKPEKNLKTEGMALEDLNVAVLDFHSAT